MEQIGCFSANVFLGILSGAVGGLFISVGHLRGGKTLRWIADGMYWLVAICVQILGAAVFRLPDFRLYSIAAAFLGMWLYRNSFHRILAFFEKKLYNKCRRGCRLIFLRLSKLQCKMKSLKK